MSANIRAFELETQFFGFSPVTVVDLVINAINDYVLDGAEGLRQFLLKKTPKASQAQAKRVIWQGVSEVLSYIQDLVDKNFDLFELYCFRNIFVIPSNVTVPGDLPDTKLDTSVSSMADELIQLRTKLAQAKVYQALLRRKLEATKTRVDKIGGQAALSSAMREACKQHNVSVLSEHIKFIAQQANTAVDMVERTGEMITTPSLSASGSHSAAEAAVKRRKTDAHAASSSS